VKTAYNAIKIEEKMVNVIYFLKNKIAKEKFEANICLHFKK